MVLVNGQSQIAFRFPSEKDILTVAKVSPLLRQHTIPSEFYYTLFMCRLKFRIFIKITSKFHQNFIKSLSKFHRIFIQISSNFYQNFIEFLSKFHRIFIQISSNFYPNFIEFFFIKISSNFYQNFIKFHQILSKFHRIFIKISIFINNISFTTIFTWFSTDPSSKFYQKFLL